MNWLMKINEMGYPKKLFIDTGYYFLPMKFDEVGNSCEAIFSDKEQDNTGLYTQEQGQVY